MPNLLKALKGFLYEVIFVADRCTDKTVERVRKYRVKIIEKNWRKWTNSYAESLQTGYLKAKGKYISIIDADIVVPATFFKDLVPMIKGRIASVDACVETYPDTLWNRAKYAWEKTYAVAPLGRAPYGAARVILKKAMDDVKGFRDVPTPDTDIDTRLVREGYKSLATSVKVYHIRHVSFRNTLSGQINRGRGRYALGISLIRTIGHALFRLRPFVICGWLLEWQTSLHASEHEMKTSNELIQS
jgi:glycosyltransferase involved in cell wall biosynthesis